MFLCEAFLTGLNKLGTLTFTFGLKKWSESTQTRCRRQQQDLTRQEEEMSWQEVSSFLWKDKERIHREDPDDCTSPPPSSLFLLILPFSLLYFFLWSFKGQKLVVDPLQSRWLWHKLASTKEGDPNTSMVSSMLMLIYAIKSVSQTTEERKRVCVGGSLDPQVKHFSFNVSFCQKSGRTSAPTGMLTLLLFPELVKTTNGKLKRGF